MATRAAKSTRRRRSVIGKGDLFELAIDGYIINQETGERRLGPCAVEEKDEDGLISSISCSNPYNEWYEELWLGAISLTDGEEFNRFLHRPYFVQRCSKCGSIVKTVAGRILPDYYDGNATWSTKEQTFRLREGTASGRIYK